jgi:hypothetical protein
MGIVSRLFDTIDGIYWFPVIALAIFAIFFILIAIHTLTMEKSKEAECGTLPFENDEKFQSREV